MNTYFVSDRLSITTFFDGTMLMVKEWGTETDGTMFPPDWRTFKNSDEYLESAWANRMIKIEMDLMYA